MEGLSLHCSWHQQRFLTTNVIGKHKSYFLQAGNSYLDDVKLLHIKRRLGVLPRSNLTATLPSEASPKNRVRVKSIPKSFDARTRWPNCPSIGEIRDQGSCGSCWVTQLQFFRFSIFCIDIRNIGFRQCRQRKSPLIASVLLRMATTRLTSLPRTCCLAVLPLVALGMAILLEPGKIPRRVSVCRCGGGYPDSAWNYYVSTGIVSGGNFNSNEGCRPFTLPTCEHHVVGPFGPCPDEDEPLPACTKQCISSFGRSYKSDLHFGELASGESVRSSKLGLQKHVRATTESHNCYSTSE